MLKFIKNDKSGERLSVTDDRDPEDLRLGVLNVVSGIGYFYPTINLDAAYDANELKTIVRKLKRIEKLAKQRVNPRDEVCANADCRTPFLAHGSRNRFCSDVCRKKHGKKVWAVANRDKINARRRKQSTEGEKS